jgi:hypothetical protein
MTDYWVNFTNCEFIDNSALSFTSYIYINSCTKVSFENVKFMNKMIKYSTYK